MTSGRHGDRRVPMLARAWSLLLLLLASSLVMTATVHAREVPGQATTIECTGVVHVDGDADQSQGDADKAIPHHHGTCHGQALSIPQADAIPVTFNIEGARPKPGFDALRALSSVDPALRPPNA